MPDLKSNISPTQSLEGSIPPEIVYQILTYQFRDLLRNDHPGTAEKFNENLTTFVKSNLTVNKTFSHICQVLIYRYCNLTTAKRFHGLLQTLKGNKTLCNKVEVADFQELTSIGLGRSSEMNKMIKNLTNETLLEFLMLTKANLREFLACENIQDDLDDNIIKYILSPGKVLSVVDFCGCSGTSFTESFIKGLGKYYPSKSIDQYQLEPIQQNYQITCLGLNDCIDLPSHVLWKILKMLPELQKLDLSHTSIDDSTLYHGIPHWKNLTHLSLATCLQVTPRAVLEFFSHHPTITDPDNTSTLEWLNVSVIAHSSSWNEVHTMFLLKKLCQHGHNKTLQYLNIGGLPLHIASSFNDDPISESTYYHQCRDSLQFIKWNFPKLKSLSIKGNNVPISTLVEFLTPNDQDHPDCVQKLKFLNISGNSYVNKWTIQDSLLYTCSPTLVALEVSFESWQQIEKLNDRHEIIAYRYKNPNSIIKDIATAEEVKWKCYIDSSYGRRYWLYRADPFLNRDDLESKSNLTRYDLEGHKIIEIINQPDFLKFAQSKIMLGCGLVPQSGVRRKLCYRDLKPPVSQFLNRKGAISLGNTPLPIISPTLPRGGWRIIHNENEHNNYIDTNQIHTTGITRENALLSRPSLRGSYASPQADPYAVNPSAASQIRDGLYWDRSVHDLRELSLQEQRIQELADEQQELRTMANYEETDDEYLHDPDLQRRRSQLRLFESSRSRSGNKARMSLTGEHSSSGSFLSFSHLNHLQKRKNYYYTHPDEFIYDLRDPRTTQRYRLHFEVVNEYQVFGCIERGMYRYYSLKA
ncbi:hypothetical protein SMKI_12G4030 [Saccharomyces mikatae IFO 1815]|uniref:YLR352W n=1 Tax=Saccharomyces mikatae IFO 1815 TaxID=226126 RepID=A0AA35ISB8_SACMI|nr:uncharacterized protein SMKI_12G4030 [Saccharomyces mikatae IFO 1815]CAI4035253.1 hypothetical protein SMKI_12G4030 [Saccharomyces mikatae IFO 1815]